MKLSLILVFLCVVGCSGVDLSTQLLDIINSGAYNPLIKPPTDGNPLLIQADISFESVQQISSTLKTAIYVEQIWTDSRLYLEDNNTTVPVLMKSEALKKIWKPDLYFAKAQGIASLSNDYQSLKFYANGQIIFNQKVTITVPCDLDPIFFPFDEIVCTIQFMSFGYESHHVDYQWKSALEYNIPEEDLTNLGYWLSFVDTYSTEEDWDYAKYSSLCTHLHFTRTLGVYFLQVYVPATFIVALSWLGFWLNRNATPARASLGITTVLTMLTLVSQSSKNYDSAINNSVNAIDIYTWFTFISVVLSMLMFACGDFFNTSPFFARKLKAKMPKESAPSVPPVTFAKQSDKDTEGEIKIHEATEAEERAEQSYLHTLLDAVTMENDATNMTPAERVDIISRVFFPLSFLIFNIIYWFIILLCYLQVIGYD